MITRLRGAATKPVCGAEIIALAPATFFCNLCAARQTIFPNDLGNPARMIEKGI
jgi:hypothetical protein